MYRSLKLCQTLVRTTTRLYPIKTSPACHLMQRQATPMWPYLQSRRISGEGEGKGGGGGGAIRSAGGTFGKKEAAEEDMYFREQTAHQIKELKRTMRDTLTAKLKLHEKERDTHADCLKRHQEEFAKDRDAELHQWHINHHQQCLKVEQEEIDKIKATWKKMHLD
ncbi:hypothetical protein BsWGS_08817 [Bradybaena similaris]